MTYFDFLLDPGGNQPRIDHADQLCGCLFAYEPSSIDVRIIEKLRKPSVKE
jgi:hypothetical protein